MKKKVITTAIVALGFAIYCGVWFCKKNFKIPTNAPKKTEIETKAIETDGEFSEKNENAETKDDDDDVSLGLPESIKENIPKDMQYMVLLQLVLNLVKTEYVKELSEQEITEKAIAGLLSSLDIHSSYLDKKTLAQFSDITDGEFGGIGTEIMPDEGFVRIISPIDDTPAYKAGLKSGDLIIYIDDECVNGMKSEEVVLKLRGKPKTKVKLKIKRDNKDPFDVELTRDIIKIQSVKNEYLDKRIMKL